MGSERALTRKQAAKLLGVTTSRVSQMTRAGMLRTKLVDGQRFGGEAMYDPEEVSALLEARKNGGRSLPEVNETAQQAWAAARVAQRELEALKKLLGLHRPILSMNSEAVEALHLEAQDALQLVINGAEKVNYWANVFFGICDLYLERVAAVMGTDEPWSVYLDLSTRLAKLEDFKSSEVDPSERVAYHRLHASRERLRHSIFIYCVRTFGKRTAIKMFPSDFEDAHYDVMLYATDY